MKKHFAVKKVFDEYGHLVRTEILDSDNDDYQNTYDKVNDADRGNNGDSIVYMTEREYEDTDKRNYILDKLADLNLKLVYEDYKESKFVWLRPEVYVKIIRIADTWWVVKFSTVDHEYTLDELNLLIEYANLRKAQDDIRQTIRENYTDYNEGDTSIKQKFGGTKNV